MACVDDRVEDVRQILAGEAPAEVVVEHVTEMIHPRYPPEVRAVNERIPFARRTSIVVRDDLEDTPDPAASLVRWRDRSHGPCIYWARSRAVLELLVAHGADPHARDDINWPPVVRAAQRGDMASLRYLLEDLRVDVNARVPGMEYGTLHVAQGREMVAYLLERGADPSMLDANREGPVAGQVQRGDVGAVRFLLARPGGVARDGAFNRLRLDPDMLAALLEGGVRVDGQVSLSAYSNRTQPLLHRLLGLGFQEARAAADETARRDVGARLLRCVETALAHGFDPTTRDAGERRATHVLADHGAVLDEESRRRLTEVLAPFDGPRPRPRDEEDEEDQEGDSDCTCGLELGPRVKPPR